MQHISLLRIWLPPKVELEVPPLPNLHGARLPCLSSFTLECLEPFTVRYLLSYITTPVSSTLTLPLKELVQDFKVLFPPAYITNVRNLLSICHLRVVMEKYASNIIVIGHVNAGGSKSLSYQFPEGKSHRDVQMLFAALGQALPVPLQTLTIQGHRKCSGSASLCGSAQLLPIYRGNHIRQLS